MKPLIITRPERQSAAQRWGFRLLTLLFWGFFGYCIWPLLTIAVWVVVYWRFQIVMIENHGIENLANLLRIYGIVILGMALMLISWSLYNLLRYGHHEKRTTQPSPATAEMLAEDFRVNPDDVRTWQSSRKLVLDFDPTGQIIGAHCSPE